MKKIGSVVSLLFLVLFILVSCNKSSSDWVEYNMDKDGNVFLYKKGNIEKKGESSVVQLWIKEVFSDEGKKKTIQNRIKGGLSTEGYDKLSDTKIMLGVDCKKRMTKLLSSVTLDTNHNQLNYNNYSIDKTEWKDVVPDSTGDKLLKEACK